MHGTHWMDVVFLEHLNRKVYIYIKRRKRPPSKYKEPQTEPLKERKEKPAEIQRVSFSVSGERGLFTLLLPMCVETSEIHVCHCFFKIACCHY